MSAIPRFAPSARAVAAGAGAWLLLVPGASLVVFPARFAWASCERLAALLDRSAGALTAEQLAFLRRSAVVHAALSLALVAGGATLLVFLLQRRRCVPRLALRFYGLVALAGLFDWHSARRAAELGLELPDPGAAWFVAGVATIVVAGGYLALSRRSRATFVN